LSVCTFQARSPAIAETAARTTVNAVAKPKTSLIHHGRSSMCDWPPTWLQATKNAIKAIKNNVE
jgi:hypothetical protein